jgi:hypothetical protein
VIDVAVTEWGEKNANANESGNKSSDEHGMM